MSLQEAINYSGPDENLVHEDTYSKVFEIRVVARNGGSFLMEPGVMYRIEYEHPQLGKISRYIDFYEERAGGVPGTTEEALLELVNHRLKAEHARTGNDRIRHAALDVEEALQGLHILRKAEGGRS